MRRTFRVAALAAAAIAGTGQAKADTVIIYTDPMTLERKVVVRDTPGPDRAFHCFLPPSEIGCQRIAVRRGR
jgi:hypothetical protein